jgi:hypothetical protein
MNIGRKIYFDKLTGEVIHDTGDRSGAVIATSIEQDVLTFKALNERVRTTFDVLEYPFGQNKQDFAECNGYRVNPSTKALEFSYPVPGLPEAAPTFVQPLTEQITELKNSQADLWELVLFGGA